MPLPITIPNTFANATATIPLSQLDNNFSTVAVAVNSIGNGAFTLANAQITGGTISNVTLDNVSVDVETLSNVTITNLTVNGNATLTNAAVTANTATITTATFGAGSNTAPSITTSGDTNTGIFFPAADTIAFTEGGVESMRIDSSGNLGLGVTPSAWSIWRALQIGGTTAISDASGNTQLSNNYFRSASADTYLTNGNASIYRQLNGQHIWFNAPSGTAGNAITFTQAMTLDASGNLGIGTTSLASVRLTLNAASGSANGIEIQNSGDSNRGGRIWASGSSASGNFNIASTSSGYGITFNTDVTTERARITSGGDLLVGTTSTGGAANNTSRLTGGIFSTVNGAAPTLTSGTAATIFTLTNTSQSQTWLVSADLNGEGTTSYACVYLITLTDNSVTQAVQLVKGSLGLISVSGLAVKYTQSSGGTKTNGTWSAIRIM